MGWPPGRGASPEQVCIWEQIVLRVRRRTAELADDEVHRPDYPELLEEFESDTPRHGFFYRVQRGDTLTAVATEAIRDALSEAGMNPGMAAGGAPQARRLRVDMMNLIECAPWDDGILGSPKEEIGSVDRPGSGHYAPHGRGISFNAVHADNRGRMAKGQPPRRSVVYGGHIGGEGARHDGTGGRLPYLWIPRLDLQALRGTAAIVPQAGLWPNGLSGIWPPPEIVDLGAENVPTGGWGCEPYTSTVPPR